jgi:hypothetical protein
VSLCPPSLTPSFVSCNLWLVIHFVSCCRRHPKRYALRDGTVCRLERERNDWEDLGHQQQAPRGQVSSPEEHRPRKKKRTDSNHQQKQQQQQQQQDLQPSGETWRESLRRTDVKSGPYTQIEKDAIRSAIQQYAESKGLTLSDRAWLFPPRGKRDADTRGVWKAVATALPHRTVKSVQQCAARMLHPDSYGGQWTPEEDSRLLAAAEAEGHRWTAIGVTLGRTGDACRDRWKVMRLGEARKRGRWGEDEVERLKEAVQQYQQIKNGTAASTAAAGLSGGGTFLVDLGCGKNVLSGGDAAPSPAAQQQQQQPSPSPSSTVVGGDPFGRRVVLDDIDWGAVSLAVGTRSHAQCIEKWYDHVCPSMQERGEWGPGDDRRMLRAIYESGAAAEHEVAWGEVAPGRAGVVARRRWRLVCKAVPKARDLEFSELLEYLVTTHMPGLKEDGRP